MKMMIEEGNSNNDSNNNRTSVVLDKLEGMFHQEESDGYKVPPFLDNDHLQNQYQHQYNHHHVYCPPSSVSQPPVDVEARTSIAKWCYKIMSILKYSSETAEIAMSCLDRFVSSSSDRGRYCLQDRCQYRLAALTCVYTISKVYEITPLSINFVIKLSSNANSIKSGSPPPFTRKQIELMEVQLLMGLQFRINPITTIEYVYCYLELLPQSTMDYETRQLLIELCQYQITRSVVDYKFCIERKSLIGFAALLNAIDSIYKDGGRTTWDVESMITTHYIIPNLGTKTSSLQRLRSLLLDSVASDDDDNLESSSRLLLLQGGRCSNNNNNNKMPSYYQKEEANNEASTRTCSGTPPPTEITITTSSSNKSHRRSDVVDDDNDQSKPPKAGPGLSNSPRSATYMM